MIMKEIIIQGMSVYVETDKDGYVSFSTKGSTILPESFVIRFKPLFHCAIVKE